jgi:hypothetical protein
VFYILMVNGEFPGKGGIRPTIKTWHTGEDACATMFTTYQISTTDVPSVPTFKEKIKSVMIRYYQVQIITDIWSGNDFCRDIVYTGRHRAGISRTVYA